MALRPELQPRPVDPARRDRLALVIRRVAEAIELGQPAGGLMAEHDALAGRGDVEAREYEAVWAGRGEETAAVEALMGPVPVVPDITRAELVEIARRVGDESARDGLSYWLELFTLNTPARGDSDLFFWPDPEWLARIGTDEPSPEQIVDEALRPH